MVEQRRFPRYPVKDVEGTFLFNVNVGILNLSLAGMAVETTRPLTVGHIYAFRITKDEELVKVNGRVVWSVLGRTRRAPDGEVTPVYHAGIQFEDILTPKAHDIQTLIEEQLVLDVRQRLFGRFHLTGQATASVDTAVEFEVRKLSLSGMLAETYLLAEVDTVFPLEIRLGEGMLAAKGRVAWVNSGEPEGERPPKVELGVEFVDMSEDEQALLDRFIDTVEEAPEKE